MSTTVNENGRAVGPDEMCDKVNTESTAAHWVEELFPPTFRLSLQGPIRDAIAPAVLDSRGCDCDVPVESKSGVSNEELFAKLARGMSPLDVASIVNIYQRVWLMMPEAGAATRGELLLHYIYLQKLSGGMLAWLSVWDDVHIAQQMPLPLTISCSSKARLVLTCLVLPFWYVLTRVVPDICQKISKTVVCVCVCVCVCVVVVVVVVVVVAYLISILAALRIENSCVDTSYSVLVVVIGTGTGPVLSLDVQNMHILFSSKSAWRSIRMADNHQ